MPRSNIYFEISRPIQVMALPVMEFQGHGYKIRKIFAKKSTYPKEITELTNGEPQ